MSEPYVDVGPMSDGLERRMASTCGWPDCNLCRSTAGLLYVSCPGCGAPISEFGLQRCSQCETTMYAAGCRLNGQAVISYSKPSIVAILINGRQPAGDII